MINCTGKKQGSLDVQMEALLNWFLEVVSQEYCGALFQGKKGFTVFAQYNLITFNWAIIKKQ